jgi:hypothetical protein
VKLDFLLFAGFHSYSNFYDDFYCNREIERLNLAKPKSLWSIIKDEKRSNSLPIQVMLFILKTLS